MSFRTARRARRTAAATASLLLAGSLAAPALAEVVQTPADDNQSASVRYRGANRFETAADLADQYVAPKAMIVTSGRNFPDALAGAYLARVVDGPMVLTEPDDLPAETRQAIVDSGVETVYVLGGTAAVSQAVEDEIDAIAGVSVVRVKGDNRYETGVAIATFGDDPAANVGMVDGKKAVILATGQNFPDALVAGATAYAGSLPILLTRTATLHPATRQALTDLGIELVLIAGGTAAVSQNVENELQVAQFDTRRIKGDNRFGTAVAFAQFNADELGFDPTSAAALAYGRNFPDALAMGPFAGQSMFSILLSDTGELTPETRQFLATNASAAFVLHIAGGTAPIPDSVANAARDSAKPDDPDEPPPAGGVTKTTDGGAGSLRQAIIDANANPGQDTITLANGANYVLSVTGTGEDAAASGDLDITDDLVIEGNGATITGDGADRVLDVIGANLTVTGLSLTNGAGDRGGALRATGADTVVTYTGGTVADNAVTFGGGGMWVGEGATLTVDGTTFTGNTAAGETDTTAGTFGGGGALHNDGATLTIRNATIGTDGAGNDATGANGSGGGVLSRGGALSVTDTVLRDNTANRAGGGVELATAAAQGTFTNVDFVENTVIAGEENPGNGGALHVGGGTVTVTGGDVLSNQAIEGGGFWSGAGSLTVEGTEFYGNKTFGTAADNGGGAIFVVDGDLAVTDATIGGSGTNADNVARSGNEAVGSGLGSGGAILVDGGDATITTSNLSRNRANRAGGAIELRGYAEGEQTRGSLQVDNVTFRSNFAAGDGGGPGNGGAIHVTGPGDVTVSESLVTFNTAVGEGGGLWNDNGSMLVERTLVEKNSAEVGGGLYNERGFLKVVNTTLSDNSLTADDTDTLALPTGTQAVNGPNGIQTTFQFVTVVETDTTAASTSIVNQNPAAYGAFALGSTAVDGDCTGVVLSAGNNVVKDSVCLLDGGGANDLQGTDPELNALATNGNPLRAGVTGSQESIKSHAPTDDTSPVVDFGSGDGPTSKSLGGGTTYVVDTDQRGFARGVDGDGAGGSKNDTGAVEFASTAPPA